MVNLSYFALVFTSILICAFCDNRGFAVVAPDASINGVQVSVGGTRYNLTAHFFELPYYNATFNVNLPVASYHYIVDGVAENFLRTFPADRMKTYNDFFGRQNTTQTLSQLGWPFQEKQQWKRSLGPNGVFDDDYISTIFFLGSVTQDYFTSGKKSPDLLSASAAIISKDDIYYSRDDVSISGRHGDEAKIAMTVKFRKNYHGRSVYKLRPSINDPAFIREKIYNDVLGAIGNPHQESSFVRVYVNSAGLGLYHLQEQTRSTDFAKTQFYSHLVAQPKAMGTSLDCSTGADYSVNASIYAFQPTNEGNTSAVQALILALADLDVSNNTAMAQFDANWFSIDHFFRSSVMDYLTGNYDSYWFFTTNFVLYDDPTEGIPGVTHKFYHISQDFDQTFGVNLGPPYNEYGSAFTYIPYTVYVNKTWNFGEFDGPHRTMIDRLLSNQLYVNKFEATLKTVVKSVMNPIALGRRIDSVAERIRPDIDWDRGLGSSRIRNTTTDTPQWTLSDFDNSFNTSVGGNWGLKTFISERASFIASRYSITFDNPPLNPPPPPVTTGLPATTAVAASTGSITTHKLPKHATSGSSISDSVTTEGDAVEPPASGVISSFIPGFLTMTVCIIVTFVTL